MSSCKACFICGTDKDDDEVDARLGGSLVTSEGRGRRRDRFATRFLSFFVTVVHSDELIAQDMIMDKRRYRTNTSSGWNNHLFVIVWWLSFVVFFSLGFVVRGIF